MFLRNSYWLTYLFVSLLLTGINNIMDKSLYGELVIPKIELNEKIYYKESKYNNLKYGLYLLEESNYLEDNNGQMIIVSHSGTAKTSYFKNLDKLNINDEIKIIHKNEIYVFKVIDKYYEKKDGKLNIKKPSNLSIALVTCTKNTFDLQTVIIAVNTGKIAKM